MQQDAGYLVSHHLKRRIRGDLIQFLKFERSLNLIKWHHGPIRGNRRARLFRELVKNCKIRFNWFVNRIAVDWNALPNHVINASSVNDFKNRLDQLGDLLKLNTLRRVRKLQAIQLVKGLDNRLGEHTNGMLLRHLQSKNQQGRLSTLKLNICFS